jgi:hypothetical protein
LSKDLVGINCPNEPGVWDDILIYWSALLSEVDEGKQVKAGNGHQEEST